MCTALTFKTEDFYFGRTLDLEYRLNEFITVMPRGFGLALRQNQAVITKYAVIGMATTENGFPLYYDGANEKGLCMAGLNFPHYAHYFEVKKEKLNITPFEFIPFILSVCKDTDEAVNVIRKINLCDIPFSEKYPLTPLHWIVSDKKRSVTVECIKDGLKVYENPVGILTNSPPFDYQMTHLCDYMSLSRHQPLNRLGEGVFRYSGGMGAIGLPGDFSSASRFVRIAFVRQNSVKPKGESQSVSQFFHLLGAVSIPCGCVVTPSHAYMKTQYTCCINAEKGIYYVTTYDNSSISAVDMKKCDLESKNLISFPI